MKEIKFYKVALFVNCLVPLALLGYDAYFRRLGANPLEFITRTTGTLTLVFLLLSLAVTPARKLTGVQWLVRFRRMLGLYAFFYALLHFTTYIWFDKFFDVRAVVADTVQRPFVAVGMFSFFLLVPLAVTSTNAMIKRLGGKRWARLHRAVYLAAAGGCLHYYMLVKADTSKPLIFAAVLALLLGYRLYVAYSAKLNARPISISR
ncbi:MAG TPA: protein-methionine-sulfoxide reductase heme-binding subunit MsrQ [Pyrinomonadaceae bacterium]|nr:protein-methionine-sulfoxide reductase heme-binding subunit MsrQ [Pyrinomonadaceae bacterium]